MSGTVDARLEFLRFPAPCRIGSERLSAGTSSHAGSLRVTQSAVDSVRSEQWPESNADDAAEADQNQTTDQRSATVSNQSSTESSALSLQNSVEYGNESCPNALGESSPH